jgi:hypothetical protein
MVTIGLPVKASFSIDVLLNSKLVPAHGSLFTLGKEARVLLTMKARRAPVNV